jgi:hypothetical protein
MNARTVTILWVIAVVLGIAVAALKLTRKQAADTATRRTAGQMVFESFPATDVSTIRIEGASTAVTLEKKSGSWTVAERDDYPANARYANDFIRTLGELKVAQAMEAGPSFAPRFGMDQDSKKPDERGLTATFMDPAGKELAAVSLGKTLEVGSGGGRFIRNHADDSGFYSVTETFPAISADPKRWLANDFISLEKIKSIDVTPSGGEPWKVSRQTEDGDFTMDGLAAGETLDASAAGQLKNLMSYARFEDVVPAAVVEERKLAGQERTVVIETFEGFIYQLAIVPAKPADAAGNDDELMPAAADNQLLTVSVNADLPAERKKEEGESEEDAKQMDEAFTTRLKSLEEKLEKEKAFADRTFEVGKYLVENLLKDRSELIQKKEESAAQADDASADPAPQSTRTATSPPIQAFTPPIEVPPATPAEEDDETSEVESDEE